MTIISWARVLLINKNRPYWQKGKLNGIGGHIEEGETPEQAMVREFKEEADKNGLVAVEAWRRFAEMEGPGRLVPMALDTDKMDIKVKYL